MELNKENGELQIELIVLTPMLSVSRFMALFEGYSIKSGVQNSSYSTYYIRDLENSEISISALFYNEKLQTVTIALGNRYVFPPFESTNGERQVLLAKLDSMGGANVYSWGRTELLEDIRGGVLSIGIRFR